MSKFPLSSCDIVSWIKGQPLPGIKLSLYIEMNIKHIFCRVLQTICGKKWESQKAVSCTAFLPSLPVTPSFFPLTPDLIWCFPRSVNKESGPVAGGKREFNHHRNPDRAESTLGQGSALQQSCGQTITQAIKGVIGLTAHNWDHCPKDWV